MKTRRVTALTVAVLAVALFLAACSGPDDGPDPVGGSDSTHQLTMTVIGPGTVVIDGLDFSCSDECTVQVSEGLDLVLKAQPQEGRVFSGWSGDCSGTSDCNVQVDGDLAVVASFVDNSLGVVIQGSGDGSVRVVPPDAECDDDCGFAFESPVNVSITATADGGSRLANWGGACGSAGSSRQCVVNVDGQVSVIVNFERIQHRLTVSKSGDGSGAVTSSPSGISCGDDCSHDYSHGTSVTLTAKATDGSTFEGWGGVCGDASGNTCTVSMTQARSVTAEFDEPLIFWPLNVNKEGSGAGTVTSTPGGINCGGDCSEDFQAGTEVELTASASPGSSFAGWGGACSGTASTCQVTMSQVQGVSATFNVDAPPPPEERTLNVSTNGPGIGSITIDPPGRECSDSCTETFEVGTSVTLTANPGESSSFEGWVGACQGSREPTCRVTMNENHDVQAVFEFVFWPLSVDVLGEGSGTVTVTPPGTTCSQTCDGEYSHGTTVTLRADAEPGSQVAWGGECAHAGSSDTCELGMTEGREVTVFFEPIAATTHKLQISPVPTNGTITSTPNGIECGGAGADCQHDFDEGSAVSLTAVPAMNYNLKDWSGACADASGNTCNLQLTGDTTASASFVIKETTLAVAVGIGGTVSSRDGEISSCSESGGSCVATYPINTSVTLNATAYDDYEFANWEGCEAGPGEPTCTVTLENEGTRDVTAQFQELAGDGGESGDDDPGDDDTGSDAA